MTYPTKAIYQLIINDSVKVAQNEESLYQEKDVKNSLNKIECIQYHQKITENGITFTAYNAGHVLGAAMFLVEINGVKILYTGDYSREIDRHLHPAEIPDEDIQILLLESTYGIHEHEKREIRERNFTKYVREIVERGGKCLLPVFSIGRAQELLLILEEYWEMNPELNEIKIYYVSSLAHDSMNIFQEYINMGGEYVKKKLFNEGKNPFKFSHIECQKNLDSYDKKKPIVVFASPGMMQSSLSRSLFEEWCQDDKNGVIITGYSVDGTLAKNILGEPSEIEITDKNDKNKTIRVPLKMSVKNVTFSAHSDYSHSKEFVEKLQPKFIVLVHGKGKEIERLRRDYEGLCVTDFRNFLPMIFNPKNCQRIVLNINVKKNLMIVGNLCKNIKNCQNLFNDDAFHLSSENKINASENNEMDVDEENNNENEEFFNNYIQISGLLLEDKNILIDNNEINKYSELEKYNFKQILKIKYNLCIDFLFNL